MLILACSIPWSCLPPAEPMTRDSASAWVLEASRRFRKKGPAKPVASRERERPEAYRTHLPREDFTTILTTLVLTLAVQTAPAQGKLGIANDRLTHGYLGGERKSSD